jgi:phosphoribosyl-dephospho-CoA transferase
MLERHKLVWLSERGWQTALDRAPPCRQRAIDQWRRADWPAVVRRADNDAADHQICIGIALAPDPADGTKIRIPLRAAISDVKKILDPVRLAEVIAAAPQPWRPRLDALERAAQQRGLSLRVYGSLALQALTGRTYVTAASDIDLLFYPTTCAQLDSGLQLLALHSDALPLDGEIIFPSGQAVAWKEWMAAMQARSAARVLVKEKNAVRLTTTAALLATLQEQACMR